MSPAPSSTRRPPHRPSPTPATTSARPSRSPAGSTTCAAPARSASPPARRHRHHAVRGGEERAARRDLRGAEESDAGIVADRHAARSAPSSARPAASNWTSKRAEIVQRVPEADPYPITPKDHGIDFLMDHRHLWLRSRRQHAILRVRHEVIKAIRDYFDSQRLHPGGHARSSRPPPAKAPPRCSK